LWILAAGTVGACAPAVPGAAGGSATTGSATTGGATPAASGKVQLPTYAAFQGPPPDIAGSADGLIPPAYFKYPLNPTKSVPQPIGSGEDVTAATYTTQAPPTPADQNPAWQRVNQETGFNVKLPLTQLADYPTALNTTIAGGSLPDLLSLGTGNGLGIIGLPEFLQSQCMDLTALVGGDAIKNFPNLANLPPFVWRNAVFNNRIYAIPSARASISGAMQFGKGKLLDTVGGASFKDPDDFLRAMQQLTVPGTQYGLGATSGAPANGLPGIATYFLESFGAPNIWQLSNGKLIKDWETDEFKAAIAYVRKLWDAGVIYPDSPTATVNQGAQNFYAGKYALWTNSLVIGDTVWNRAFAQDPQFAMRAVAPFPASSGGKPVHFLGSGANLLTVMKKTSDQQATKLLGLLNYLSAPFGTQEYLTMWYGVEGQEFQFDENHNPLVSQKGQTDLFIPWPNVGAGASVLYDASSSDYARVMAADVSVIQKMGIQNPVVGLYSQTNAQKAASLNQTMGDGLLAIIFGRSDVGSYDQLVADWRSHGGDAIRAEFEQALSASA
jgi:putative aldouronate transport system substrate-binding protein